MDFNSFKKNFTKYQNSKTCVYEKLTKEQKEFIFLCRDNDNPISFTKMTELWSELGWGYRSSEVMRKSYIYLKEKSRGKK